MPRPTINDIARQAGVSKTAVSFALNDRPGVSESTRQRVLAIADALGWMPSAAARSLNGTGADAVGLVLSRPARTLGVEPFFMQLIAGIEGELSRRSMALVFQVVENHAAECDVYRSWWGQRRVDGVLVVDPFVQDDRVDVLTELGMPAVFIGVPHMDREVTGVWSDDSESMRSALQYLSDIGHRSVAYVGGHGHLEHVRIRAEAFREEGTRLGLAVDVVVTDYTPEEGAAATRQMLLRRSRPTALIYDNDVMALAALGVARELGVGVPDDVSIVAWDDSTICQAAYPQITALRRDIPAFGAAAASLLLGLLDDPTPRLVEVAAPRLVVRGTSGPPG